MFRAPLRWPLALEVGIVEFSDFLDTLQEGDVVLADKGFNVQPLLARKGVKLLVPSFMFDEQLAVDEVQRVRTISSSRVHIERFGFERSGSLKSLIISHCS